MTARLRLHDVSVSFDGKRVVDRVSATVTQGELVGLIGPNGAGKTSLLRAIARLTPCTGNIRIEGQALADLRRSALARRISYLPQSRSAAWPITVRDVVTLGRLPHRGQWQTLAHADQRAIDEALEKADVVAFADRPINTLSEGERARVMLARALAVEAPLLLADEPTAALDPYHQLQIMEVLQSLARNGASIIVVTHDLSLAARFCTRLWLLAHGRLLADGGNEDVLSDQNVATAYGVEVVRDSRDNDPLIVPWRRLNGEGTTPPPAPTSF